jgi:hypothetical protein
MVDYIPWASVGEYIERIKNNKDASCQLWLTIKLEKANNW